MEPAVLAILAWVFTALLLFLFIVALLASRGTIPRNHILGIRLPPLFESDAAWRAGHAAAIMPALVGFIGAFLCACAGAAYWPIRWGVAFFFVLSFGWAAVVAVRAANATDQPSS